MPLFAMNKLLGKVQVSKWEPEPRSEPAPRTEPAARTPTADRTEIAPRTETAARTEPENNNRKSVRCPSCGYILFYVKGTEKQSIRCIKCGNTFQVE